MNNIKFSIIVPAFKSKYLKECIDSILMQTFNNFELIILNDDSPEDIDNIVSSYQDNRIRYYKNDKNVGAVNVVDNWNKLLGYAQGEYLICMGDDDKLLPNCLEEYNKLIEQYPLMSVYHGWTEIINEESEVIEMQEPRPIWESAYSMVYFRMKGRSQYIGDFLFDTNHLREVGGFVKRPLAWGSDDLTAYVASRSTGIVNSQIPIFQYRVNSQTISNSNNMDYKIEAIKMGLCNEEAIKDKPIDSIDLVYWNNLKRNRINNLHASIISNLSYDVSVNSLSHILHWLNHKKKLGISWVELCYAIVCGIIIKFRN
jgi:glycosyltransferase involved in cell wall biosynthesis